jgi:hypothetical protein
MKHRYYYVPMIGRFATWYVPFWPSNTTIETISDYAKERGMMLYWDRDIRRLAIK